MNSDDFAMWLKGFLEGTKHKVGKDELKMIEDTLGKVTKKLFPLQSETYNIPHFSISDPTDMGTTKITWS